MSKDQGYLLLTAGLHLQPLLPLFHSKGSPDVAFMQSYTKALYFVSECLLLLWLFTNSVIRYTQTTDLSMLEIILVIVNLIVCMSLHTSNKLSTLVCQASVF